MKPLPITLIVLTKDEELNLPHCLEAARRHVAQIIVVDSGSQDQTLQIAEHYGADVYEHPFSTQAEQLNWALDNTQIHNDWILRLDADEVVSEELWGEIREKLPQAPDDLSGFYLKRKVYFMGRWIRHGGYYPTWLLRLFRKDHARSEERLMDEHIVLASGRAGRMDNDFKDENHKSLSWWIAKHNDYSSREALELLKRKEVSVAQAPNVKMEARLLGSQPERRRWMKQEFYNRMPLFLRPFIYFFWRYFILLGFLDGRAGFLFHFLQGLWYRLLVDAKYCALLKEKRKSKKKDSD